MTSPPNVVFRELPNIDDASFNAVCVTFSKLDRAASDLVKAALRTRAPAWTVTLVVGPLMRVRENAQSLGLLCSKGRVRDAAVLLVNLIELRLDLQYIALDAQHEAIWLRHQNKKRKPWKVKDQFQAVCSSAQEREAEEDLYQTFSMIKHGNPAGGEYSFNLWKTGESLAMSGDAGFSRLASDCLTGASFNLAGACVAATRILGRHGADLQAFTDLFGQLAADLSKTLNSVVAQRMSELMRTTPERSA